MYMRVCTCEGLLLENGTSQMISAYVFVCLCLCVLDFFWKNVTFQCSFPGQPSEVTLGNLNFFASAP